MEFGIRSLKLLLSFSPPTVFCRDRLHLGTQTQIDTNHLSKHLCRSNVPALARADNVGCQVKTMLADVKLLIDISRNRGKWTAGLKMPQVWLRCLWQVHFFSHPLISTQYSQTRKLCSSETSVAFLFAALCNLSVIWSMNLDSLYVHVCEEMQRSKLVAKTSYKRPGW